VTKISQKLSQVLNYFIAEGINGVNDVTNYVSIAYVIFILGHM
jgi:hypothetical protein